ncbi:MAG: hypothetical protein O3C21_02225 [Verrucomicrobia bacterium]|nr:hypothetical protein [Verrucomicrobiota bacterium]
MGKPLQCWKQQGQTATSTLSLAFLRQPRGWLLGQREIAARHLAQWLPGRTAKRKALVSWTLLEQTEEDWMKTEQMEAAIHQVW